MLGIKLRHAREFFGYFINHKWERTDEGNILFPRAHATIHGTYSHAVNGEDWREDSNLITNQGLSYLLQAGLTGEDTAITAWYLAPYGTNIAPNGSTWTGTNFHTNAGELATSPEGYDEVNRVLWDNDNVDTANTEVENTTTPAEFTMNTASTITVYGVGMLDAQAKSNGGATDILLSATQFAAGRTFNDADVFSLKYKIDLDPS